MAAVEHADQIAESKVMAAERRPTIRSFPAMRNTSGIAAVPEGLRKAKPG
jgi:hypothetical protein